MNIIIINSKILFFRFIFKFLVIIKLIPPIKKQYPPYPKNLNLKNKIELKNIINNDKKIILAFKAK